MNIILMGPPGAGKGTQAGLLTEKYGLVPLSTGQMFRERIASGDAFGQKVKGIMDEGKLVPDEMTIQMIAERISQPDCRQGFILDGFPRNVAQAEALEKMLKEKNMKLDAVIALDVDDEKLIERIAGRFSCSKCGEGYHDTFKKPASPCACDKCGTKDSFARRSDDNPETLRERLNVYHNKTKPILSFYKEKGILKSVDGMADMPKVTAAIEAILGRPKAGHSGPCHGKPGGGCAA